MGRYVNTALGQRWTDEPLPDEPSHLQYPARAYQTLGRVDAKLDYALAMGGGGSNAPAFTTDDNQSANEADIEEVGKLLVEGKVRLPKYARVTVTTEIEEVRSKVFGTYDVYTHTADELCCHQMQPMSIQAALAAGLLAKLNGAWLWRENVYRRLVPPDPRLVT
jgi:hypothetical protein